VISRTLTTVCCWRLLVITCGGVGVEEGGGGGGGGKWKTGERDEKSDRFISRLYERSNRPCRYGAWQWKAGSPKVVVSPFISHYIRPLSGWIEWYNDSFLYILHILAFIRIYRAWVCGCAPVYKRTSRSPTPRPSRRRLLQLRCQPNVSWVLKKPIRTDIIII